jgi:hypothetical protein
MTTEVAQLGSDGGDPGVVQQADHEIAENGEGIGAVAMVDQASVLVEGQVLGAMQLVFDLPVGALECQEILGVGNLGREASDPITDDLVERSRFDPGAFVAEDLSMTGPVKVTDQVGGGDQATGIGRASVARRPWSPHVDP